MRTIKLSGREASVIRCIDFATGVQGAEILSRTHIEMDDLVDIVNGLMDSGFIETIPAVERVHAGNLPETMFEVNPAYASDLRAATSRRKETDREQDAKDRERNRERGQF